MKQTFCLILIFCLLLSGCSIGGERIKEPVTFYYINKDYRNDMEQVIVSEMREASGHRDDLDYLLALYSLGPANEELQSPLPRNTKIISMHSEDDSIALNLSASVLEMSDVEFTLASACISLTCMELTGVQQITVTCGDRTITIQKDHLMLYSQFPQNSEEVTK